MRTIDYARWFRGSTPYISAHRNKTFVILLPGEAFNHANLTNVVHDIALLQILGAKVALVHGARPQIEAALPEQNYHGHRRLTDENSMNTIAGVHGQLRSRLEALFSTGLPNTPLHNVDIPVNSGNFVVAKPVGIVDGVDHLLTGEVRRVETARVQTVLDSGGLVLQSPIGYSPSGQVFNLTAEDVATALATQISADKLIVLDELSHVANEDGARESTFTPTALEQRIDQFEPNQQVRLNSLVKAVRAGVGKSHLISYAEDGALLAELFTAEGIGTQVLEHQRKPVRQANIEDVSGIVEVIRPLEEAGVLVRRERDRLEQEVEHFLVAELDGIVVGCCAVFAYPEQAQAELACVAVHENYRSQSETGIGKSLLDAAERQALQLNTNKLFALTTQTKDWFLDQGFVETTPDVLPTARKSLYNWQRGSHVMLKELKS